MSPPCQKRLQSLWPRLRGPDSYQRKGFRDNNICAYGGSTGTMGLAGTAGLVDCPPCGAAVCPAGITIGFDGASIPPSPPAPGMPAALPSVPSGTVVPQREGKAWGPASGNASSLPPASA